MLDRRAMPLLQFSYYHQGRLDCAASPLSSFMLLHIHLFIRKKHTSIERQR